MEPAPRDGPGTCAALPRPRETGGENPERGRGGAAGCGSAARLPRRPRRGARRPPPLARPLFVAARERWRAAARSGDERCARRARDRRARAGAESGAGAGRGSPAPAARTGRRGGSLGPRRASPARGILGGPDERAAAGDPLRADRARRTDAVLGLTARGVRAGAGAPRSSRRLRTQPPFGRSGAFRRGPAAAAAPRRGRARARRPRRRSPGAGRGRVAQRRRRRVRAAGCGFTRSARRRGVRRMEMELLDALKQHFGYDAFRKGQEAIVRSVLSGRPTIAILPTGGGKSLCYQLPALLLEGTSVVVSPLVALMKDQVDALRARGIAATFVNSSLPESERQDRQAALRRGEYRLVYVAPERFKSPSFLSAMADVTVPLLAVDEAHCTSASGRDFRSEDHQPARARELLRAERVLALTATATPEVRRDIADALELRDPRVFVAGFDRPNLFIEVLRVSGDKDKLGRLVALSRSGGPGIVYAATRKNVEKVVGVLRASDIDAVGYHAGMADAERTAVQERSEEHTSELQSQSNLVCRLLLE